MAPYVTWDLKDRNQVSSISFGQDASSNIPKIGHYQSYTLSTVRQVPQYWTFILDGILFGDAKLDTSVSSYAYLNTDTPFIRIPLQAYQ